jgi:phage I-like protein
MRRSFALNFELPADAPARVQLIPAGEVLIGRDGRRWIWDAASQQMVMQNFASRGLPLAIDVNHSSELKAPRGEASPAYGWIEAIEIVDGALYGDVTWNPLGTAAVKNREYRFLSPVFDYDMKTGRIVALTSVALVNEPNLRLPALNHQERNMRHLTPAILAALTLLGVDESDSDDQIGAKLAKVKADLDTTRAANAQQPSLDRYVPRADYDALAIRAANAEQALKQREAAAHQSLVDTEIAAALAAGKITPATEAYHRASCSDAAGLERFRAFCAAAPVIGDPVPGMAGQPPKTGTALNAAEREICAALGLTEAAFLAARAAA